MTFRTLSAEDFTEPRFGVEPAIRFSPAPSIDQLPSTWFDLHVWDDHYHDCENDRVKRFFRKAPDGRRYIVIGARRGVRLSTVERLGVDPSHTAVVVNAAGKAKHGLIVAPGKVDPGFQQERLVLVVFNQSRRPIRLFGNDKIACIAFASISAAAKPTRSRGHSETSLGDYEPTLGTQVVNWLGRQQYDKLAGELFKMLFPAALALAVAYIVWKMEWLA